MDKRRLYEIGFLVLTRRLHKSKSRSNSLEIILERDAKDQGILADEAKEFARITSDVISEEEITG